MNIQQASEESGLSKPNIRYYEKEGLLKPGRNPGNGYREYEEAHVERLRQIKCLRALGISVPELRQILEGEQPLWKSLERRSGELQKQQAELLRIQEVCDSLALQRTQVSQLDGDLLFLKLESVWKKKEDQMRQDRKRKLDLLEEWGMLLNGCGIAANCAWQGTRMIPIFSEARLNPFVTVSLVAINLMGLLMLIAARNLRR